MIKQAKNRFEAASGGQNEPNAAVMNAGGRTLARRIVAFVVTALIVVAANAERLRAFNPYYDDYLRISARPLAMGQTGAALADDPSSVFYNPAGIAKLRRYSLLYNHSARHMPDSVTAGEVDQLDGDTEAIVVPLGPYATAAAGFNFQGEMGYDYRPLGANKDFVAERYAAVERVEALGLALSPWTQVGVSRRSFFHQYERPEIQRDDVRYGQLQMLAMPTLPTAPGDNIWPRAQFEFSRVGDGQSIGVRQWVAPGVFYGYCDSKVDFDYAGGSSGRFKRKTSGWAFHPVGWLTLTRDRETLHYRFQNGQNAESWEVPTATEKRKNFGAELNLAGIAKLRWGRAGGGTFDIWQGKLDSAPSETVGVELTLCGLKLNYSEAKDYLARILGYAPDLMRDIHIYGFTLTF